VSSRGVFEKVCAVQRVAASVPVCSIGCVVVEDPNSHTSVASTLQSSVSQLAAVRQSAVSRDFLHGDGILFSKRLVQFMY
jgi:hypothetical protein